MDAKRQWIVGAALLSLVVLAGSWFLLITPQRHRASQFAAQTVTERSQQDGLRAQLAVLTAEAARLPHEQSLLARAQVYLPLNPELPGLIRQLTCLSYDLAATCTPEQLATGSPAVEIVSVSPGTPTAVVTPSAASTTASPLYQIPLTISASGSYFDLENFQANLEQLPRTFVTDGVSITPGNLSGTAASGTGPTIGNGELRLVVTGRVFMTTTDLAGAPGASGSTK